MTPNCTKAVFTIITQVEEYCIQVSVTLTSTTMREEPSPEQAKSEWGTCLYVPVLYVTFCYMHVCIHVQVMSVYILHCMVTFWYMCIISHYSACAHHMPVLLPSPSLSSLFVELPENFFFGMWVWLHIKWVGITVLYVTVTEVLYFVYVSLPPSIS